MIKSDMKKGALIIAGETVDVLNDFTMICRKLRELLTECEDEEFAERTIVFCVALSRKSAKDLEKEAQDETDNTESDD